MGTVSGGGYCTALAEGSGSTPEEAVRNTWKGVLALAEKKQCALVRMNCKPDVPVPGDEPQVWVRWNASKDDWEDVPVSWISPEKIRPYKDQVWRDHM